MSKERRRRDRKQGKASGRKKWEVRKERRQEEDFAVHKW